MCLALGVPSVCLLLSSSCHRLSSFFVQVIFLGEIEVKPRLFDRSFYT